MALPPTNQEMDLPGAVTAATPLLARSAINKTGEFAQENAGRAANAAKTLASHSTPALLKSLAAPFGDGLPSALKTTSTLQASTPTGADAPETAKLPVNTGASLSNELPLTPQQTAVQASAPTLTPNKISTAPQPATTQLPFSPTANAQPGAELPANNAVPGKIAKPPADPRDAWPRTYTIMRGGHVQEEPFFLGKPLSAEEQKAVDARNTAYTLEFLNGRIGTEASGMPGTQPRLLPSLLAARNAYLESGLPQANINKLNAETAYHEAQTEAAKRPAPLTADQVRAMLAQQAQTGQTISPMAAALAGGHPLYGSTNVGEWDNGFKVGEHPESIDLYGKGTEQPAQLPGRKTKFKQGEAYKDAHGVVRIYGGQDANGKDIWHGGSP